VRIMCSCVRVDVLASLCGCVSVCVRARNNTVLMLFLFLCLFLICLVPSQVFYVRKRRGKFGVYCALSVRVCGCGCDVRVSGD